MYRGDAVGRYCANLCAVLTQQGFSVDVYTAFNADMLPRVKVHQRLSLFPKGTIIVTPFFGALASWVLFGRSGVLWFQYPHYHRLIEPIRYVAKLAIFDYHNVTPPNLWRQADGMRSLLDYSIRKLRTYAEHAEVIVTHSDFSKNDLILNHGLRAKKIVVIPYPVDLDLFRPTGNSPEIIERFQLEGHKVLLFVGRIAPNKRIDILIEGFEYLRQILTHKVKLLIVGSPYDEALERQRIKRIIRERHLEDCVYAIEGVRTHELPHYYSTSDLFVTASEHEGFCMPIVEAMACGTPVVGSNCTAIPETMGPGGLLFETNSAIDLAGQVEKLFSNQQLYLNLSKKALGWSKRFSMEAFTARIEKFLQMIFQDFNRAT